MYSRMLTCLPRILLLLSLLGFVPAYADNHAPSEETTPLAQAATAEPVPPGEASDPDDSDVDVEIHIDQNKSEIAAKVLKKLTEKGIIDSEDVVFETKEPEKKTRSHRGDDGFDESVLVGIFAVIFIFGMPVFIVAIIGYQNFRKQKLFHESVNMLIERGMDIPPELYEHFEGKAKKTSNLSRGVKLIAIGFGLIVFLAAVKGEEAATLGVIPLFLGIANLLIHKLDSRNASGSN